MGEVYVDMGVPEARWQEEARSRAMDRRTKDWKYMPAGSYWVSFLDEHDEEIYGFWMQRRRRWSVRDSANDAFEIKSFRKSGLMHRAIYFEIGDVRGKEAEYGYGLRLETAGDAPLQWLLGQMRNIKDRAEAKFKCLNATEWYLLDTEFDSRSGRRLRIPATMIHEIVVCKFRPPRQIGEQQAREGFDRCGAFPYGNQSLSEWIQDVSGEDGRSTRRSRRGC